MLHRFTDDYKNRAKAAAVAKMRVESDMSYQDLGLVQPEGGLEVGELEIPHIWFHTSRKVGGSGMGVRAREHSVARRSLTPSCGWLSFGDSFRQVPMPEDVTKMRLVCRDSGEVFTFKTRDELSRFKYQRYMQRYLRTIQSVDDNVGRLLDYLDKAGLSENTMVIYTCECLLCHRDHQHNALTFGRATPS